MRKVEAAITIVARKHANREQRGRCFWCDRQMIHKRPKGGWTQRNRNAQCTADHLIPSAAGGPNQDFNIVAACYGCNHERGDRPVDQWLLRIQPRINPLHFATILQKITKWGITGPIGQPASAAPMPVTPDCPPPKETAPAP